MEKQLNELLKVEEARLQELNEQLTKVSSEEDGDELNITPSKVTELRDGAFELAEAGIVTFRNPKLVSRLTRIQIPYNKAARLVANPELLTKIVDHMLSNILDSLDAENISDLEGELLATLKLPGGSNLIFSCGDKAAYELRMFSKVRKKF
jgi:hypothetical protein